ncbi:MAG: hypothetical protein JNM99_10165 [Verrucomicrobiaceae bacterium]|nr:hypothetical protein [Verrucomicrobiaceae bacterium]
MMLAAAFSPSSFFLWLSITVTLMTMMSMAVLRKSEEALQKNKLKLEDQILSQQHDLIRTREAASAWRLEMQRQFDAYRADASKRIADAEQRAAASQQHLEETLKRAWKTECDLRSALERALKLSTGEVEATTPLPQLPAVPEVCPSVPALTDATDDLRTALAASEQKVADLVQQLSVERFKSRRTMAKLRRES